MQEELDEETKRILDEACDQIDRGEYITFEELKVLMRQWSTVPQQARVRAYA